MSLFPKKIVFVLTCDYVDPIPNPEYWWFIWFFAGCFDGFIFFAIIAGFDVNWMDN